MQRPSAVPRSNRRHPGHSANDSFRLLIENNQRYAILFSTLKAKSRAGTLPPNGSIISTQTKLSAGISVFSILSQI